jgi:hypothetical protein
MADNGRHGNATHSIYPATYKLRRGEPFDGHLQALYLEALARRGLTEPDLDDLGAPGDVVRNTARLGVIVETIWGGLLMAASVGDVAGYLAIVREHGHRFDQLNRMLLREISLMADQADTLDYEDLLRAEREAGRAGD